MSTNFPHDPSSHTTGPWLESAPQPPIREYPEDEPAQREWLIPAGLFFVTLLSTTYAGLFYAFGDVGFLRMIRVIAAHPSILLQGVPFSFTFILILLAHEMGHFLACKYYGIRCTPPFFIPFPISYAGTLGAFIRIKSHFQHKRALFDVGIAGPLAGFAFALPALVIGIASSRLIPRGSLHGAISFGEPILLRLFGKLILGYSPAKQDMIAHPIAMAAWFGLLATSLNLFPIWQLDGGHITYALFGREWQKRISIAGAITLMLISFAGWPIPSYFAFACLILILGMRNGFYHPPTLFEDDSVGRGRKFLGALALLILIISFTPVPIYLS